MLNPRSVYDPISDPAGPGGYPTAAPGVCHWSAPEERQRGSVEINQPMPDWNWWVKEKHAHEGMGKISSSVPTKISNQ